LAETGQVAVVDFCNKIVVYLLPTPRYYPQVDIVLHCITLWEWESVYRSVPYGDDCGYIP